MQNTAKICDIINTFFVQIFGTTAEYSQHSLVLLQDCPNPNPYPNHNVRKYDFYLGG